MFHSLSCIENLSSGYTKYINKKKNRLGHLFQDRYKAIILDADMYLLELVKYIHNNPVRAGMVEKAVHYTWSSHQVYLDFQGVQVCFPGYMVPVDELVAVCHLACS